MAIRGIQIVTNGLIGLWDKYDEESYLGEATTNLAYTLPYYGSNPNYLVEVWNWHNSGTATLETNATDIPKPNGYKNSDMRIVRCEWHNSIKAVVAIPAIRLSTSEARRVMPKNVPISDAVTNMGALTLLLNGLKTGDSELIKEGMFDKLHEPYRWKLIKGGLEVKEAALEAGALGCAISGAGPSILALCKNEYGKVISQAMVKAWEKAGVASRAPFLNIQTSGSNFSSSFSE